MKTAYIISMHCPLNYGAILQTYGLQTYLESLGLKVMIINYQPHYIVHDQSLMYVGDDRLKQHLITRWAYRLLKAPTKIARRNAFSAFAKNELHLTPLYKTYEEIKDAGLDADYFICGSDQIWNVVSGAHKDPSYFLDFAPKGRKRIAYAASGNLPITEEVKDITFPLINKIDCISMREDSTIESIQPFINKPITHVCDPVFLIDAEKWRELYKKHSSFKPREKYVLVYPMGNGGASTVDSAAQIAKSLGLPLYKLSSSQRRDSRIDKKFNVTPYDFLALLDNAEYVLTNSFHGTAFSIIFEKQFLTCTAVGTNQRIMSLLQKAGLENRSLNPNIEDRINSHESKQNMDSYIIASKSFLEQCIF